MIDVARLAARPALDNVFRELAFTKIALVVLRELPACLTNTLGEAHAFEELQSRQLLLRPHACGVTTRLKLFVTDDAGHVRLALQRSVDFGLLLFSDHALARMQDLGFESRPELLRHDLLASSAHAELQVFPVDLQSPPVISNASHKQMDMGVVGVVMIDCDPLKLRIEIALLFDQATHVFREIQP
jgi:hypothetical protein